MPSKVSGYVGAVTVQQESPKVIPLRIPTPLKGLVLDKPAGEAPLNSLLVAQNVHFVRGVLTKIPGASARGTALDGPPLAILEYVKLSGTSYTVAITEQSLYYWNYSTADWVQDTTGLVGNTDHLVSWTVLDDALIFTNFYQLKRWTGPGTITDQITTMPSGVTSIRAKYLASFDGRLLLFNLAEDGASYPERLRYSVKNNSRDLGNSGSGYYSFDDNPQAGAMVVPMGDYLVIGKERTLYLGRPTGSSIMPYSFRTFREGIGPAVPFSLTIVEGMGWFLGWDEVYELTPAAVTPISTAVSEVMIPGLNDAAFASGWASIVEDNNEAWLLVAEGTDTSPTSGWIYNWKERAWTTVSLPGSIRLTTGGVSRKVNTFLAFGDLQDTIGEQTWTMGYSSLEEGTPVPLFGGSDGQVYELDESLSNWNGNALDAIAASQVLTLQDKAGQDIEFYLHGIRFGYLPVAASATITVELSFDEGTTWSNAVTVTFAAGTGRQVEYVTAHYMQHCTAVMFRLRNNVAGENFRIVSVTPLVSAAAEPFA
jgi:hypothetical protein